MLSPEEDTEPTLPVAESRAVMARHARSFQLAARFLPPQVADEAALVYAFCRLVDDTADEAPSLAQAREGLAALSDEMDGTAPPSAAVHAYQTIAARRGIPPRVAQDLIAGVSSDLGAVRVADDPQLIVYCYQVAGTVGLMMCGVLGVTAQAAWPHALSLGIAMQLTNICRDVLEDAGRDRVYLPLRRLAAAGVSAEQLLDGTADRAQVAAVVRDLLALADDHYAYAEAGMHFIPWRARLAILIASRVYRGIGVRLLRRHGGDPLHGRTTTSALEKLGWVLHGLASFLRPRTLGLVAARQPAPPSLLYVPLLQGSEVGGAS